MPSPIIGGCRSEGCTRTLTRMIADRNVLQFCGRDGGYIRALMDISYSFMTRVRAIHAISSNTIRHGREIMYLHVA